MGELDPRKLTKQELVRRVAAHPAHVYPGVAVLQRWTRDELLSSYLELVGRVR